MQLYFVYIVECSDGLFYTGITNDLNRRIQEHNSGYDPNSFTHYRRPVELKYAVSFQNVNDAIASEKKLKGWSRKKKEALFNNDWEEIKKLAKSKNKES